MIHFGAMEKEKTLIYISQPMALKGIHINREVIAQNAEAKELWENVLKPKWEEQSHHRAEKLILRLKDRK